MALLVEGHTIRSDKRLYGKKMLGMGVPQLIYFPHIELRRVIGLLGLLRQKSRAMHPF
jgi:hypothetical protein